MTYVGWMDANTAKYWRCFVERYRFSNIMSLKYYLCWCFFELMWLLLLPNSLSSNFRMFTSLKTMESMSFTMNRREYARHALICIFPQILHTWWSNIMICKIYFVHIWTELILWRTKYDKIYGSYGFVNYNFQICNIIPVWLLQLKY